MPFSCGLGTRRAGSRTASCSRWRGCGRPRAAWSRCACRLPRGGSEPRPTRRRGRFGAATRPRPSRRSWSSSVARWWRSARTASSGTVSFEVDDGSGPLRIVLGASLAADGAPFSAGTWVEVLGVLGQETTGAQPLRGYRVWPRSSGDVRILAAATGTTTTDASPSEGGGGGSGGGSTASLAAVGGAGLADLRVGATLVASAWPELEVAGLLWDGSRLVGITPASAARVKQATAGKPHARLARAWRAARPWREGRGRHRARLAWRQPRRHGGWLRRSGASVADPSGARRSAELGLRGRAASRTTGGGR